MPQTRQRLGMTVFDKAIERLAVLYEEGHRVVVSFSGGKDSGVCVELAVMAARLTGRLPVEVVMRDEEIMYPGTFEYAERVAEREEIDFHWLAMQQPIINVFNREQPYWWVFDPELKPEQWVREPPGYTTWLEEKNIDAMTHPSRFPPAEGKTLFAVIGLRVSESRTRLYSLYSARSYLTKPNRHGVRNARPIYDFADGDIWKAIHENGWDYNHAYDVMHRMGISRSRLRIAPPTLNASGAEALQVASKAWPQWFDKVCTRLPGVRLAAHFGKRSISPSRIQGESWEHCFHRECVEEAPAWIGERSIRCRDVMLSLHRHHATTALPERDPCYNCKANLGSWRKLTEVMWNGDPFCLKQDILPYVEPEFFREGAGTWGSGKPTF